MPDYEKLGVFYLGRKADGSRDLLLYDSRHLLTHAVCVGMTGSGKTGLCIGLIEEAAIDGIPALVIDLKGDLANLALTFPALSPADFRPFVDEDEARRNGLDPDAFAARQAETWRAGLAQWDQTPDRIARLQEAADVVLYTPASRTGVPVSILSSFNAPPPDLVDDREAFRQRVSGAAASLLALAGIEAATVESREQILLATILDRAWRDGLNLDLAAIIQQIQQPPVAKVGVVSLDSFFPPADRFTFAMRINNLLASPGFEAWLEGDPLDIGAMLHGPSGKPRIAVVSLAHLNDAERMFFLSLLLNQVVAWMRTQPGTSSLRALLYLDEIFGFFPPVANPPTKQPLLTLLKQARAFGLGVVLATQNPVDIDYKGLSNAGTWFVGRLQTERDKNRLLDGLEGAAGASGGHLDRAAADRAISSLAKRVFLLHDVHAPAPELFETRWTLSYLRGPLNREQLRRLPHPTPASAATVPPPVPASLATAPQTARAVLPPEIPQQFVPIGRPQPAGAHLVYRPMLFAAGQVRFTSTKPPIDTGRDTACLVPVTDAAVPVDWTQAERLELAAADLEAQPSADASYGDPAPAAAKAKNYAAWQKAFVAWLYQNERLELYRSPATGSLSNPGESERDFRIRLQQLGREQRDRAAEALRARYAPKITVLEDRLRRAQQAVEREREQVTQQRLGTAISVGATLLGAFFGSKVLSATTISKAGSAARSYGRLNKESQDVARASETVQAVEQQLAELNARFEEELALSAGKFDALNEALEPVAIQPKKTNIQATLVCLAWTPYWREPGGNESPAW